MKYSLEKVSKELEKITEDFKKNKDLDEFCQGIGRVAKKLKTDPMVLYAQIANKENFEFNKGHYECKEVKLGKAKCSECANLMESDKCIGDSIIAFGYRILHPEEYKPPHFRKKETIKIKEMPSTGFEPATS